MSIKQNIFDLENEIEKACIESGRQRDDVRLLAVSKFNPASSVFEAIQSGLYYFGESRVQEASEKIGELTGGLFPHELNYAPNLRFAFIGHLQKNKVKKAVELFDEIQSVDSLELLCEIEKRAKQLGKKIDVLFELHTAEDSKSGFMSEKDLMEAVEYLVDADAQTVAAVTGDTCSDDLAVVTAAHGALTSTAGAVEVVPGEAQTVGVRTSAAIGVPTVGALTNCSSTGYVNLRGLMTMAPFTEDEELIRKAFRQCRDLFEKIKKMGKFSSFDSLSMGMSNDYKIAISEGATIIRIGTSIFGERNYNA